MSRRVIHHIVPGDRYGCRTIIREVPKKNNVHRRVEFVCDCGYVGQGEFHMFYTNRYTNGCISCQRKPAGMLPQDWPAYQQGRDERVRAAVEARRAARAAKRLAEVRPALSPGRPRAPYYDEVMARIEAGQDHSEIAREVGCSRQYVRNLTKS